MKSIARWALLAALLLTFVGHSTPVRATCAAPGTFSINKCTAGKITCALKKKTCLLGCYKKAATGVLLDPLCLAKCRSKFDGGGDPAKSCFGKLEGKLFCLTVGDTAAIEQKVDGFVESMITALHNTRPIGTGNKCLAGKIKCLIELQQMPHGDHVRRRQEGAQSRPRAGARRAGEVRRMSRQISGLLRQARSSSRRASRPATPAAS